MGAIISETNQDNAMRFFALNWYGIGLQNFKILSRSDYRCGNESKKRYRKKLAK